MKKLRELTTVKEHIICGKCPQRDHCKVKDLTYTEYLQKRGAEASPPSVEDVQNALLGIYTTS